jgi:dienelactone hydrolase
LKAGFGGAAGGKLVVPNAAGVYPLIVASHGFSATADNQVGWAEHFASYGFVVAVPTFPGGFSPDHVKNGVIIKTIVAELDTADTPAKGKIDKTRVGLEGHSAGGLATTLAAADLSPGATVLFDPVDNSNLGKTAYAKLCGPVVALFANPSMCNNSAGWFDFRTTAKGPTTSFRVKNSTHCDGENAPRSLCGFTCGGAAEPSRQNVYARYATAFFLANLKGDGDAAAVLALGALTADTAIGESSVGGGPSCVTPGMADAGVDGGTTVIDSGSSTDTDTGTSSSEDASTSGKDATSDAASGTDAVANQPEDTTTQDETGCSCSAAGAGRAHGLFALLLPIAALVIRRGRSRASHH